MLTLAALTTPAIGQDHAGWPQWRGPLFNGVSPDGDPPIRWSERENIRFKVAIDGDGLATPIVWGDRLFVLSALPLEAQRTARRPPVARRRQNPPRHAWLGSASS